jgi:type III secretory pathway component EscS
VKALIVGCPVVAGLCLIVSLYLAVTDLNGTTVASAAFTAACMAVTLHYTWLALTLWRATSRKENTK